MTVGATTILMPERPTPDATFKRWLGQVGGVKPTVFYGVPTLFAGLLASPDLPPKQKTALRVCTSAGEALPPGWHWMFFNGAAPMRELGEDGHPRRGGFLPPINHLPRRMWAGGRIIASRRKSAMRKDVTQHMYGGDITRKMKLREKQKKGKKRKKRKNKAYQKM